MDRPNDYKPPTAKIASHNKKYHVFLSFRGPDVRKTLVDHLFESLSVAGLHVFLDNERLEKGEDIDGSLRKAIEDSAIHIPIFSKTYAQSYWCLEEVTQMSKSHGWIIPLFYDVQPSDVRYPDKEKSPYAAAFREHSNKRDWKEGKYTPRYSAETIAGWKKALYEVSSLSGWSMEITSGYEAKLVKRVALDVLKTLNNVPLEVAKFSVGLKDRMSDVMELLKIDLTDRVITVGIWGMGGIGKTTLTKAVYNDISLRFEASCFVSDVRTSAQDLKGLRELQTQVVKDLLKGNVVVDNVDRGKSILRSRLGSVRALLVLDDVDHMKQLEALGMDWLGLGSRVIVTTRDQRILKSKENVEIWKMEGLNDEEALELFSWHSFLKASPEKEYQDLSMKVVRACGGLPLSLEVLGSFLYNEKDRRCWIEALMRLESVSFQDIFETLKISYNALCFQEKQIFLDIACFFIGTETEIPKTFWEASNWTVETAVMNLSLKSLVKLTNDDKFQMHDQLRDMGRAIVASESHEDPGRRSRLWHPDDVNQVILQRRGTDNVRGLVRSNREEKEIIWQTESFASMRNLQLLWAEKAKIEGDLAKLPPNLKWLKLEKCSLECLSSQLNMENLAVLQLKWSQIKELWDGTAQSKVPPRNLKVLKLSSCCNLQRLPNLSYFVSLTRLVSRICRELSTIPDSIGLLQNLKSIEIQYCRRLQKLPQSMTKLSSLEKLSLVSCTGITKLPNSLGKLRGLKELELDYMEINELPDLSFGRLTRLEKLSIPYCRRLKNLPSSIGALERLRILDMRYCPGVSSLPPDFGNLRSLEKLLMSYCALVELPQSFGSLGNLKILKTSNNVKLTNLPQSFGDLGNLTELIMNNNSALKRLPCSFSALGSLVHLEASQCDLSDGGLPAQIGDLSSLEVVHLQFNMFSTLPATFTMLTQLTELYLHHCTELLDLPTLPRGLVKADIGDCVQLRSISDMSSMKKLEVLVLCNCKQIAELPGIESLQSLRDLNISGCNNLQNTVFVGLKRLKSLHTLHLSGCDHLSETDLRQWFKELLCLQQLSLSANGVPRSLKYNMIQPRSRWIEYGPNIIYVDATVPVEKKTKCTGFILCFLLKFEKPESQTVFETVNSGQITIERDGQEIFNTKVFTNRQGDFKNQLYICIYRQNHPLTMRLQGGDKICVISTLEMHNSNEQSAVIKKSRMQLLYTNEEAGCNTVTEDLIFETLESELSVLVQNYKEEDDASEDAEEELEDEDDENEDDSDEDDEDEDDHNGSEDSKEAEAF